MRQLTLNIESRVGITVPVEPYDNAVCVLQDRNHDRIILWIETGLCMVVVKVHATQTTLGFILGSTVRACEIRSVGEGSL